MRRFLTLLVTLVVFGVGSALGQVKQVTGVVTSADDKQSIPGVSVFVKEVPTIGASTDINGNYTLKNVPANAKTIVFRFVGYTSLEVPISGPQVNAVLQPENQKLEEVVVTGYGNFKKQAFTGSASTISTKKTLDVPSVSIENKLAGSVAGVAVSSNSGQPGSVQSVRIRGLGSMNASNQPLYVIDGVPMMAGNASAFKYESAGSSLLSTLNSNDIETLTVIKDAAAASLYGSRAANGVIVITTKRGKAGKTRFNVKADMGFSNFATEFRPVLNGEDRRKILQLGLENYAVNNSIPNPKQYAEGKINNFAAKPWSGYTDWKDLLLQTGNHKNYEVSANGGSENTNFYTSLSYTDQEGVTLNSAFERVTGRLNLNHKSDKFNIGANVTFANTKQDLNGEGTSFGNPLMAMSFTISPSSYPYNEDGSYAKFFPAIGNDHNPLQVAKFNYNRNEIMRTQNSLFAGYNITTDLMLKQTLSFDFNNTSSNVWWDPRFGDGRGSKGILQKYNINRTRLNSQSQVQYVKTFADVHNVDGLFAYEVEDNKTSELYGRGSTFPSYLKQEVSNGSKTTSASETTSSRMVSYVGRLNYNYANKYFAGGSFRRDGTSRLSPDTRWGNFWSASASWIFTKEDFFAPYSDVVSNGKLRVSYGVNGTQPTDLYGYWALFEYQKNYNGNPGSAETQLDNSNLKWEKNYSTNIGLDFTLFNRLSFTFDYYNRDTKDLLMEMPISCITGFDKYLVNIGEMNNKGFEFEVTSTNISKNNFSWTTSFNLAHNKNKITKLGGGQTEIIDVNLIHKVGHAYNTFYIREYAGVDPATGKELFYKNDGSGEKTTDFSAAKPTTAGTADPKVTGGITNTLTWNGFDLNFTFTYSLGGKAFDEAIWLQSNGGTYHYIGNVPSYYKIDKIWKGPGDTKATLPQFVYGNTGYASTRWMKSTDHLRLKNMTVGYSLPKKWLNKVGFEKVRLYCSGTNLLTFKDKDIYFDPEVPSNGLVLFTSPSLRTLTFGVDFGF